MKITPKSLTNHGYEQAHDYCDEGMRVLVYRMLFDANQEMMDEVTFSCPESQEDREDAVLDSVDFCIAGEAAKIYPTDIHHLNRFIKYFQKTL